MGMSVYCAASGPKCTASSTHTLPSLQLRLKVACQPEPQIFTNSLRVVNAKSPSVLSKFFIMLEWMRLTCIRKSPTLKKNRINKKGMCQCAKMQDLGAGSLLLL